MTAPDARAPGATPYDATPYDATSQVPAAGPFVWHDLMTAEPARSLAFYTALFGWATESREMGAAGTYTTVRAGARAFGGVVPLEARHGIPSHWVSYVAVADVDATCARARAAGGRTCLPPTDIPNVGRFAMIEDPTGAIVSPISLPNTAAAERRGVPPAGTACWHELASPDAERAADFHRAVFGWGVQHATTSDGAPHWLFLRGDVAVGGMRRTEPGGATRGQWTVHVAVDDLAQAVARATALGATLAAPPREVPGAGRVASLLDPCGAAIRLVERGG